MSRLGTNTSALPLFDKPTSIGEINCFLGGVVLQNDNSLLTGAESRVALKDRFLEIPYNFRTEGQILAWVAVNEIMVKNVNSNIPVSLSWLFLPFVAFLCFLAAAQFLAEKLNQAIANLNQGIELRQ